MRKFFEIVGLVALVCVSFIYTEKTVSVVYDMDDIMVKIKEEASKYKIDAIDAKVVNNTIVPGLNGKMVDENKSYYKMKKYGSYNPNLLVYKKILPKVSIKNNYDNYVIGGNPSKKMVSLVFTVYPNNDVLRVMDILENKGVVGNFFIDGYWLEDNNLTLQDMVKKGHNIGNLSYNNDYMDKSFGWMNMVIKNLTNGVSYCMSTTDNSDGLSICKMNSNYMIRPSDVIENSLVSKVKKSIKNGSIIAIGINDLTIKELGLMISYVKSKGYEIVSLKDLLSEELVSS